MVDYRLNGLWDIVSSLAEGTPDASPAGSYLWIDGSNFERRTAKQIFQRKIAVRFDVKPHEIDLHIVNEPDKGKTFLGIYKIEGDTLVICHALSGAARPTEFSSTYENKCVLSISKQRN